ncbi:hypothetical protein QBC34DRAFT_90502 [Podospora aff. communis PSN243]|uniref:Uncharacterized protein n=1 Tax=Podospora aff. communis PSN243 TaxID=3040156 RepID=A0AAV9GLP9_9PEZI|nr:hypothetical protein QBC34DRAFT_90502 [Podospora aff. communis PSN243]
MTYLGYTQQSPSRIGRPSLEYIRTPGIVMTPRMIPGSDKSLRVIDAMADPSMSPIPCYSIKLPSTLDRPLSIIFSPHGIKYSSLHSYVTHHLVSEAALPLTALLHCFDTVSSRLFGDVLLGAPSGVEIATRSEAKSWFSTHDDGNKISGGVLNRILLKTTRFCREDILRRLNSPESSMVSNTTASKCSSGQGAKVTRVFAPEIGDPITVSGKGIHDQVIEIPESRTPARPEAHRRGESWLDLEEEDINESSLPSPREASSLPNFGSSGHTIF